MKTIPIEREVDSKSYLNIIYFFSNANFFSMNLCFSLLYVQEFFEAYNSRIWPDLFPSSRQVQYSIADYGCRNTRLQRRFSAAALTVFILQIGELTIVVSDPLLLLVYNLVIDVMLVALDR